MKDKKDSNKFRKELIKNGYKLVRTHGDHFIYKRDGHTVSIPYRLNKMIEQRLKKEIRKRWGDKNGEKI